MMSQDKKGKRTWLWDWNWTAVVIGYDHPPRLTG